MTRLKAMDETNHVFTVTVADVPPHDDEQVRQRGVREVIAENWPGNRGL